MSKAYPDRHEYVDVMSKLGLQLLAGFAVTLTVCLLSKVRRGVATTNSKTVDNGLNNAILEG